jgi:FPC/CPF motif-containing protein YcgG
MSVEEAFELIDSRVDDPAYPCLGAKSVFHRDRATVRPFGELGTTETAAELLAELEEFSATTGRSAGLASFVAVFSGPAIAGEQQFEDLLWRQLQLVHDLDTEPWDPAVSHDPHDDDFVFSAAGTAYFVVGLHEAASRLARRFPHPTLVFNLHSQFESLRAAGHYDRMRDAIRARDERLQGSVNPVVRDHGRASSACQYSGRAVEDGWSAPFEYRTHAARAA